MKHLQLIAALLFCCIESSGLLAETPVEPPVRPGDRIAIIGNTFADQLRIHGYLETSLLQHSQQNPVSIRNLGWGGDMLSARDRPTGFPTEQSTLEAHKTDVIVACFGMGESFAGDEGLDQFKSQLNALIELHSGKTYNGKSEVRLVLVSPIAYEDLGKLTPAQEKRNKDLRAYTLAMQDVAGGAGVPFVDLFETSRYLMDEATGPDLTNNGIHLNSFGYWAISKVFYDQLTGDVQEPNQPSWMLQIDAAEQSSEARGVTISQLKRNDSGIRFRVKEESAPSLPPPTDAPLPPQLQFARDMLVVQNLTPGKYRLTIDGEKVAEADEGSWSEGVAIDSSPAHQAADLYRAAVNNKNLQFTYSWKALNQVHIVGERKTSPSGKELPKEVIEFNELANELDRSLRERAKFKTRQWRLSKITSSK